MKKTAIVTGGTKNQFPAMAVLALNIVDICPNIADELVVFHDGISLKQQKKVQQIFPTRFILYESPFLKNKEFDGVITNYFSLMVFCKYECWNLLSEYRTVLWTDYDIVITHDISEIMLSSEYYAKFVPAPNIAKKIYPSIYNNEIINTFDIHATGISCPIFYLSDAFPNFTNFYKNCLTMTNILTKSLYLPEEAVISILFLQNNIFYEKLSESTYVTEARKNKITKETKILHSVGQPKFWNGLYNEQWEKYYNKWITKYKGEQFSHRKKQYIFVKFVKLGLKLIKMILPYGFVRLLQKIKK